MTELFAPLVHPTQWSKHLLRCSYSKLVSPALDQKEAGALYRMRNVWFTWKCLEKYKVQ